MDICFCDTQDDDTFYTQFFPHAISRLYRHFRSVPAILTVSIIYLERLLSARPEFRVSRSAVFMYVLRIIIAMHNTKHRESMLSPVLVSV